MSPTRRLAGSLRTTARFTQRSLMLVLLALGTLTFFQAKQILKSEGSATSSSAAIAQNMQGRLNGISDALMSYLKNHDKESIERIKSEGREASRLLGEFKENAQSDSQSTAYDHIQKAHESLREATLNLLAADHDVVKSRQTLLGSSSALLAVLTDQMESSIKTNQLSSSARLRAVRDALEEAKKISTGEIENSFLGLRQRRFRRSISTFEELSRTRRAGHWADQSRLLYGECVNNAQALQNSEKEKKMALDRYTQRRNSLDMVLQESDYSSGWGIQMGMVRQALKSGLGHVGATGLLLIVGFILVVRFGRPIETNVAQPLRDILQCVEAASTGDMSRIPQHWSMDEVGQLSQAVGRLITVLARSENLVYHLAALVESSGEAIISHTLDGTILSWNKGAQRIYGYSAEQVKGRGIMLLSPHDEGAEMKRVLQRVRYGEKIQPFETVHIASNGRRVRSLVRVSAILDSTRKVIGASFCAQDLTDMEVPHPKSIEGHQIA